MSLYKYKPDQKKRETGVLVELDDTGPELTGKVVKKVGKLPTVLLALATADNPNYAKAHERAMRPYREAKEKGELTPEQDADMLTAALNAALAEGAMLGWYNVTDESGAPWEFSHEAALKQITDVPDVANVLFRHAVTNRHFRVDLPGNPETDAKNS